MKLRESEVSNFAFKLGTIGPKCTETDLIWDQSDQNLDTKFDSPGENGYTDNIVVEEK